MTKVKIVERVESLEEYSEEVKATLPNKLDKREIDNTPILGSNGLVTSDGIFKALDKKQDNLIIDYQLSNNSLNPIANSTVTNKINYIENRIVKLENYTEKRGFHVFEKSSTFTVPIGVNVVKVMCIGGGGGGNFNKGNGGNGGDTYFGNYVRAYGGEGAPWRRGGYGGAKGTSSQQYFISRAGVDGVTGKTSPSYTWANGWVETEYGNGEDGSFYSGGSGSSIYSFVKVTPGETVSIVVGNAGWSSSGGAKAGVCIVEW